MESRRRVVAGLSVAAVALIIAGVVAVAIDSGSPAGSSKVSGSGPATQPSSFLIGTPSPSAPTATPSGSPAASAVASATPGGSASPSAAESAAPSATPKPSATPRA